MADYIRINSADNVAVALHDLKSGSKAVITGFGEVVLCEDIPAGHKFTLFPLKKGDNVIKYGYPIGHVLRDVEKGALIVHNSLKTNLEGLLEYSYEPKLTDIVTDPQKRTFKGFRRASGEVGIRNQIWIIPTVGCVNGTVEKLAELFRREKRDNMGNVDAILSFPHNYGCSQLGDDHENTRKILRDMVLHPNAGGVLVVGLGCENNQLSVFKTMFDGIDSGRVKFMETQKVDGDELEYGLKMLREIFNACSNDKREEDRKSTRLNSSH